MPLNRYDVRVIPGTILKCEDENYALGADGKPDYACREQLYCYAVSEKLYCRQSIVSDLIPMAASPPQ